MPREYFRPVSLAQALALLAERRPGTRLLAGGTGVMVDERALPAQRIIDLSALGDELGTLAENGAELSIGALATLNDVLAAAAFRRAALPLVAACGEIATPLLRTRATVVGNVVTDAPQKDATVALLALDARLEVRSRAGVRTLSLDAFCENARATALEPTELVERIVFRKLGPQRRGIFLKFALRPGHSHALVNVGVVVEFTGSRVRAARIALGGVARTTVRARAAEASLCETHLDRAARERAVSLALRDIDPKDDKHGSGTYRRGVIAELLTRALARIADGTEGDDIPAEALLLETAAPKPERIAFDGTLRTTINGVGYELPGTAHRTLLDVLRTDAGLTGTKEGCAEGECGACTVWLDGRAVVSCLLPAAQAHGGNVTTIEGLANGAELHPLQRAFIEAAAVQCGFCIPGMLMTGAKLLAVRPQCTQADARAAIGGNICRCTGYRKIVRAIEAVA